MGLGYSVAVSGMEGKDFGGYEALRAHGGEKPSWRGGEFCRLSGPVLDFLPWVPKARSKRRHPKPRGRDGICSVLKS